MEAKRRRSVAEFEEAFLEETHVDRVRRESLRRSATLRAQRRRLDRVHKHGTLRFIALVLALIATAVVVTIAMFQTLYIVIG